MADASVMPDVSLQATRAYFLDDVKQLTAQSRPPASADTAVGRKNIGPDGPGRADHARRTVRHGPAAVDPDHASHTSSVARYLSFDFTFKIVTDLFFVTVYL